MYGWTSVISRSCALQQWSNGCGDFLRHRCRCEQVLLSEHPQHPKETATLAAAHAQISSSKRDSQHGEHSFLPNSPSISVMRCSLTGSQSMNRLPLTNRVSAFPLMIALFFYSALYVFVFFFVVFLCVKHFVLDGRQDYVQYYYTVATIFVWLLRVGMYGLVSGVCMHSKLSAQCA